MENFRKKNEIIVHTTCKINCFPTDLFMLFQIDLQVCNWLQIRNKIEIDRDFVMCQIRTEFQLNTFINEEFIKV